MKILRTLPLILLLCCTHCSRKHYRLSSADKEWMPYKENDVMVFESDTGEEDSIYILKVDSYETAPTTPDPSHQYQTVYGVNTKAELAETGIWKGYPLLLIGSSEEGNYLHFEFHNQNAYFYDYTYAPIDSLEKASTKTLRTPFKTFDDVYVFKEKPNPYMPDSIRAIMVNKFYWSKSGGLVRYDKLNGESWKLKEKFVVDREE